MAEAIKNNDLEALKKYVENDGNVNYDGDLKRSSNY